MDAGPHVKVLTSAHDAPTVAMQLRDLDGVTAVTISAPGEGAAVGASAAHAAAVVSLGDIPGAPDEPAP